MGCATHLKSLDASNADAHTVEATHHVEGVDAQMVDAQSLTKVSVPTLAALIPLIPSEGVPMYSQKVSL